MPTVHYVSRALLNENGLIHRLQLGNPLANEDLNRRAVTGVVSQTQDTGNSSSSTLPVSQPNMNATVKNGHQKKNNFINFNTRFEDLKAYKAKHGHLSVKLTDDESLYYWCRNIRSARRGTGTMKLTADGITALDAIGFDWRSETTRTREKFISFQDRVKALSEYKEKNGHLNVTIEDNKSLNDWCANIRNARNKPGEGKLKLTADHISALDAIGFDWRSETTRTRKKSISFHDRVEALREYKKKNGHLSVRGKDDKSLYDWCTNIRNARRGKLGMKLTTDGIAALDDIGFDWRISNPILQPSGSPGDDADNAPNQWSNEKGDQIFQDHVEALREYKKNNGHLNVSREIDKSLFNWCSNIRSARNKPGEGKLKLTAARIAALDGIGFDWRSEIASRNCLKPISFIDRVKALRAYKEKHGHLSVSKEDNKSLFYWCAHTRSAQRNPESCKRKVTADQTAALDAIGFDWRSESCQKISFIDRVEALRAYKEKLGHLSISKKDKSLFYWCSNIRNARNKPGKGTMKLTHERIAALDAIGFEWRLSTSVLQLSDSLGDDADNAFGKSGLEDNSGQHERNVIDALSCAVDGNSNNNNDSIIHMPRANTNFSMTGSRMYHHGPQMLSSSSHTDSHYISSNGGIDRSSSSSSQSTTTCPMELINKGGRVGIYLPDERRARIAKFHTKRKVGIWRKRIKYDCRKKFADSRPRIKGRFVKRPNVEECGVEGEIESGGSFI